MSAFWSWLKEWTAIGCGIALAMTLFVAAMVALGAVWPATTMACAAA